MFLLACLVPISIHIIEGLLNIANLELSEMATYSPTEVFRLKIYISLIGSILLTFPLWFKGFYNFSRPGLTNKERKGTIVIFSSGSMLFLAGALAGLFYVTPIVMEILLTDDFIDSKLSVYEATKLVVSISLFSGFIISLPILSYLIIRYTEEVKVARKYIYLLIILIGLLGTPEPTMIINLLFLIAFASIAELILFLGIGTT
tara:strand:- start:137 stop:745 length:609 start_codon:yes stop_codon:yes gene_type:complete